MSASVVKYCTINNLDEIKIILIPEVKTKKEELQDDDWDNRWNWDTSELVYNTEQDEDTKYLWLADCKIALSPLNDMLVIGRQKVLTIFHFKHNLNEEVHQFNLVYNTTLSGLAKDEIITSVLLLPFVSQQKKSINFRDWTSILVGFSSGYFRIYSENGKVLLAHLFHDEPILDIKCRTYSANNILAEQIDEILLIYPTAVIQLDGFTLFQTLRMCRANLAKSNQADSIGQSYINSLTDSSGGNQVPFTFKKWAFRSASDGQIHDCVNVCSYVKNDFDALVSHSINDLPLSNIGANLFMTTGIHPFVGFYRAHEGTTHTIFDELSQALFNKVKNVLSFFSQSKQKESDPKENIKPATSVACNIGLFDERLGFKICLSPNRRLAAVVDEYARVIIFDVQNAIAVRMWKGYRKAEVAWIVVEDENNPNKDDSRKALFLVIYAPKRGILEIWCAQNGPRVAAFRVGKNCKLIYLEHVMFGLNQYILQNIKQTMTNDDYLKTIFYSKCCLLNYDTGTIFDFKVPFLCALTDRNSKKSRDVHILKDLKVLLKKESNLSDEKLTKFHQQVLTLILMLKTAEIKRECLEELIRLSDDEQLIYLCAQKIHEDLLKSIQMNEVDFESKLVAQMCSRIMQLCETFVRMKTCTDLMERITKLVNESRDPPDIHQLTSHKLIGWTGNDVARILSLLAFRQSVLKSSNHHSFGNELKIDFVISDLLSHFTLYYTHLVKKNNVEIYEKLPVEILLMKRNNENNAAVSFDLLSRFLFNSTFCGDETNLDSLLNESCIYPSNLLLLLFTSWLNSPFSNHWRCWEYFSLSLFKIVDIMNDIRQNEDEDNPLFDLNLDDRFLSPSWADIIELIYKSTNITSAWISINMIKSLINKLKLNAKDISEITLKENCNLNEELDDFEMNRAEKISTNSVPSSDNDWETLHLDKENLSLLTKQLEDLFLLDMLLKSNLCSSETEQEIDSITNVNKGATTNLHQVSLSYILTSGPGIVSEIVARWAIHHKISPELLICSPSTDANLMNEDNSAEIADEHIHLKRTVEQSVNADTVLNEISDRSTLMEILEHVRRCFPNCLESDILLINCCWELLLQWNRQPLILSGQLHLTLNYLEKVSSSVLKHNVACMGWRLFIQKRFEILCNLIEKMGKKPKDRICRKELDMDENTLEQFVNFCYNLLDFMVRTSFSSETEPLPLYALDEWWCGFNSANHCSNNYSYEALSKTIMPNYEQQTLMSSTSVQSKLSTNELFSAHLPLAVIAVHQKMANLDLLIEYLHLALSIQFVVVYSVKNVRLFSLFSSSVRAFFFKDLHSFLTSNTSESVLVPSDPVLDDARYTFLFNVVTSIVQTLPVHRDEKERHDAIKFYLIANKWFNKVILLCREWNLIVDKVRLRYVSDLFLFGCDPLAEELMATVSDIRTLGRQLLVIAGMRMIFILNSRFGSLDEVSFMPPNVLFWLKSLITEPNCNSDCPISSTVLLLENIANFLHEDSVNSRICQELLSAVKTL
ncbi:hypothetical protein RDWZM_004215 [Blomia tropicalis]|uniref:Rab3 GTPase-activating protein non-catalytic subunit n=1 Tax=Blomia tropicalis TaxID=40697 RepID=A0A9Q0RTF0_BLOTA|nr:hypothetical protein RDWZM_004215 [Blomia tropicalis]